jgi:hypothetical protein
MFAGCCRGRRDERRESGEGGEDGDLHYGV